ncbi:MAG TPA: TadE/TadG family type IV pilus assembly protein [Actinomycetota bacterium]|nr:TadE/TadG family type IV pilus assembly protein [Actinomycetota bacterium]
MTADERGQATLELVLLLPVVLLVVGAIVQVGAIAVDRVRLAHAAREAVRVAVVEDDPSRIEAAARRSGLSPLEVRVTPAPAERRRGEPVKVSVSFREEPSIPVISSLVPGVDMHDDATMAIEQP